MCRVQPRLQLTDAHLVLVLEDVPGADGAGRLQLLVLLQPCAEGEGAAGVEVEGDGDAIVAGGQYPGAGQPGQRQHRQQVRSESWRTPSSDFPSASCFPRLWQSVCFRSP